MWPSVKFHSKATWDEDTDTHALSDVGHQPLLLKIQIISHFPKTFCAKTIFCLFDIERDMIQVKFH